MSGPISRSYPDPNHHDKDEVDYNHSDVGSIQTGTCARRGWRGDRRGAAACSCEGTNRSTQQKYKYNVF